MNEYGQWLLANTFAAERAQLDDETRCNVELKEWRGSRPLHCAKEKGHEGNHCNGWRFPDGHYETGIIEWRAA